MAEGYEQWQPPGSLAPGTRVGPWRVLERAGRGVQGAVYRAQRAGHEDEGCVALKLALVENNPRFKREVELLRRVAHPSLPRVYEQAEWQHPNGRRYPYVVMEFVDGVGLYAWAEQLHPSVEQVSRLLSQVASALEAVRAAGGVHRDVKGENVLVRQGDGRAVLVDAGVCTYAGAEVMTPRGMVPGTPAYRSPEAALFEVSQALERAERYEAGPEDDVYALGVMAYRVLTGEHPPPPEPEPDETGRWRVRSQAVLLPPEMKRGAQRRLGELVERMLEVRREERITASEAARALEELAAREEARRALEAAARARRRERRRRWAWAVGVAAGVALLGWAGLNGSKQQLSAAKTQGASRPEGGAVGLGDAVSAASTATSPERATREMLAEEALPEPRPGQARPDAKGQCPRKQHVALNGGCWMPLKEGSTKCEDLSGDMLEGTCFVPIFPPGRRPASSGHGAGP
jgi:hypothetical protein